MSSVVVYENISLYIFQEMDELVKALLAKKSNLKRIIVELKLIVLIWMIL